MLNLSIMNLNPNHIDEICEDIINQQRTGVSTHALFLMTFNPEYNPTINKAQVQCEIYDLYREKLDKAGAKHGVLVQATLGHITPPRQMHPFTAATSFLTGEEYNAMACPLDEGFQAYIKEQMKILASRNPSVIMIDDDCGILYRGKLKGCACNLHMAEFNRRANTNMTREELYAHTQGKTEENKYYTDIFVQLQKESLLNAVKAMREGIDEVNPSIQGVVSGICPGGFYEFSDEVAGIFAGVGNPKIVRLNGGPYTKPSRFFTSYLYNAAALRDKINGKVEIFLAETDTCPHNRYSTAASHMHGHFTGSVLEGATGAKHWITRLGDNVFEPDSGKAYRKILAKHSAFYEKLAEYVKQFTPFGCRMPVSMKQNYEFIPAEKGFFVNPWCTCVLERMGIPVYFGNKQGGAVFLDNLSVDGYSDEEIKEFFKGTLVLSSGAAEKLNNRGFEDYVGVSVREWKGNTINGEQVGKSGMRVPYMCKELVVCREGVEILSEIIHNNPATQNKDVLFPGTVRFENPAGGETIVFSGSPDTNFSYTYAFSMLNETRKKQLVNILSKRNHIPVYYTEDSEVYMRAGYLENGEMMVALFNLSYDQHEDIPLAFTEKVNKIEKLNPDGTRAECVFREENGVVRVQETLNTLMPVVLFIS